MTPGRLSSALLVIVAATGIAIAARGAGVFGLGSSGDQAPPLPPEKQAVVDAEDAARKEAEAGYHAPKDSPLMTPAEHCPIDLSTYDGQVRNVEGFGPGPGGGGIKWAVSTVVDGTPYTISAGAAHFDPERGLLVVELPAADPCAAALSANPARPIFYYFTDGKWGALKIERLSGDTISLTTANGTPGAFSIRKRSFSGFEGLPAEPLATPGAPEAAPAQ